MQHRPLVVTLYAELLEIRRLGSREHFLVPYDTIYRDAALRQADRERRERALAKRVKP